jgi:hypothetical protein
MINYTSTGAKTPLLEYRLNYGEEQELTKPHNFHTLASYSLQCLQYALKNRFNDLYQATSRLEYMNGNRTRPDCQDEILRYCLSRFDKMLVKEYDWCRLESSKSKSLLSFAFQDVQIRYVDAVLSDNEYCAYSGSRTSYVSTVTAAKTIAIEERHKTGVSSILIELAELLQSKDDVLRSWYLSNHMRYRGFTLETARDALWQAAKSPISKWETSCEYERVVYNAVMLANLEHYIEQKT